MEAFVFWFCWHSPGDLWAAALQHKGQVIQLYKIKSHLKLEAFLALDPDAEWAWHANNKADQLCDQKAGSVDMQAHADTLSWLTARARAWKLNEWLLPRLWLTWKWDTVAPEVGEWLAPPVLSRYEHFLLKLKLIVRLAMCSKKLERTSNVLCVVAS